jgi:nucleotide-binding universal stress UspA family protein
VSRPVAYVFGLGLTLLVASPLLRDPSDDSYPLSTYPMFAKKREKPLFYFVEGLNKKREAERLPPALVANAEVMQAAARVRRVVRAGEAATSEFCKEVAARVRESRKHRDIVEVRIVGARFDPVAYFERGPEPEDRFDVARCRVKR